MKADRFGEAPLSEWRKKLHLPAVSEIRDFVLSKAACKSKNVLVFNKGPGVVTRGRAQGKVMQPHMQGWLGDRIANRIVKAWNELPKNIKDSDQEPKAVRLIRKHTFCS